MPENNTRRYDYIFKDISKALAEDYAGFDQVGGEYEPKFYLAACGTAHHNNRMTDLTMLRYMSQLLATTFDRWLRFELRESDAYTPSTRGFWVRRLGEHLTVTAVQGETRLAPGDTIVRINDVSAARHRAGVQKNFFYATTPERELWGNLLKMAEHITVAHPDGSEEELELRDYPKVYAQPAPVFRAMEGGAVYLNPDRLDSPDALEALLVTHGGEISAAKKLILDLRAAAGDDPAALLPLLPYLFRGTKRAGEILPDEALETLYTQRNCEWKAYLLECAGDESGWPDRLRQRAGDGWTDETICFWDDPEQLITGLGPARVILLTDTWCSGEAERLAECAQRLGAYTLGRPTMGTLDYANPVSVLCDNDFIITWPMSRRKTVAQGLGMKNKGLPVDEYIPFTAQEAIRDLLLEAALAR